MPGPLARTARCILRGLPLYNGKGWIIHRTGLSNLQFPERVLNVKTSDGFRMNVMPNDLIGRHIYLTGRFDRCVVDALVDRAERGAVLWDIGANVGYISMAFLHRVADSRVLAVEPLHDVFRLLNENLQRFGGERSRAISAAVSDRIGRGSLVRTPGNLGKSHLAEDEPGEEVRLITGAELLASSGGRVDAIKIDVEGHEEPVISSLLPVLRTVRPSAVVFEHHFAGGISPAVLRLFNQVDYEVKRICRRWSGWTLLPVDGQSSRYTPSPDFVASPRS
jgi:FkbM family methyltransferase